MKKICVTGANGFIGKFLCKNLINSNKSVRGLVRSLNKFNHNPRIEYMSIGDIAVKKNWKNELTGYDCIIHCAGKAHGDYQKRKNSFNNYDKINHISTKKLAEQCALFGVKRFIFLSTIGVLGDNTNNRGPFLHTDKPNPKNEYAISKYKAENALLKISKKTGLEIVIIRLPLVYGEHAPGNFKRLLKLIKSRVPMPFGYIKNKRSLIGVDNLIDVLMHCINCPEAAGKTFLVSDSDDLSVSSLINHIEKILGLSSRLYGIPIFVLKFIGYIFGKQDEVSKLTNSLQIDISYTKKILNWSPKVSTQEGLKRILKNL